MELCNGHKSDKCESIRPFSPSYPGQSPFMATLNRVTQIHTDQESYSYLAHTLDHDQSLDHDQVQDQDQLTITLFLPWPQPDQFSIVI